MSYSDASIGQFVISGYGSLGLPWSLLRQPSFVAEVSPKPGPQTPRSPWSRIWNGSFCCVGSSAFELNVSRCQPTTASISVLLSLSFEVHLADRSLPMPL